MKYLFYFAVLLFIYRVIFRPKVIVEHRHTYDDKKRKDTEPIPKKKLGDYTDYEEIK